MADFPDKTYYKIGEVSKYTGLKPYVLRYWESEFKAISPIKSKNNQRMYSKQDVNTVLIIKDLLYKHKYTINGAREALLNMKNEKSVNNTTDRDKHDNSNIDQAVTLLKEALEILK